MWKHYIALGDSIAEGYGDAVDGFEHQGWTDFFAAELTTLQPALTYQNLGQRGKVTADVLAQQLPAALAARPDLVSINVGANDARLPEWTLEQFTQEYQQLLHALSEQDPTILVVTYPNTLPMFEALGQEIPAQWRFYFERLTAANQVIRQLTAEVNACLIDIEGFAPLLNPAHISGDWIHPNTLGYKAAAEYTLEILAKRFDLSQPEAV